MDRSTTASVLRLFPADGTASGGVHLFLPVLIICTTVYMVGVRSSEPLLPNDEEHVLRVEAPEATWQEKGGEGRKGGRRRRKRRREPHNDRPGKEARCTLWWTFLTRAEGVEYILSVLRSRGSSSSSNPEACPRSSSLSKRIGDDSPSFIEAGRDFEASWKTAETPLRRRSSGSSTLVALPFLFVYTLAWRPAGWRRRDGGGVDAVGASAVFGWRPERGVPGRAERQGRRRKRRRRNGRREVRMSVTGSEQVPAVRDRRRRT